MNYFLLAMKLTRLPLSQLLTLEPQLPSCKKETTSQCKSHTLSIRTPQPFVLTCFFSFRPCFLCQEGLARSPHPPTTAISDLPIMADPTLPDGLPGPVPWHLLQVELTSSTWAVVETTCHAGGIGVHVCRVELGMCSESPQLSFRWEKEIEAQ